MGHQKILTRLHQLRELHQLPTVVFTFDRHPRSVLFAEQPKVKLLNTTAEKLASLEKAGVDITVVFPFNLEFSQLDVGDYVKDVLVKQLNVKYLVIGYDHKFGANRSGDINSLKHYAPLFNFEVEEISVEDINNIAISSTKIRKALGEGKVEVAAEYSGGYFELNASVIKGKQLGRSLGYPTANLFVKEPEKIIPAGGVYFVETIVNGRRHYGMMNIGTNPTTDTDMAVKCEVHLFDFDADIYGEQMTVKFIKRIRDEKKFSGLTELKEALANDKSVCMELMTVA